MSDSGIERTSRQMIEEYARKVHSIDRASDDEKAGRVYGYGRGVLDGLTATHWEDEERFCHLCCAGLESSRHNTDCIGSDNGLAAHDRQVKAEALRDYATLVEEIANLGANNTGLRTPHHLAEYTREYANRIESGSQS